MRLFTLVFVISTVLVAQEASRLPGTANFEFLADIAAEQYAELRAFYERRIAQADVDRQRHGMQASHQAARAELRRIIGAVDTLLPPKPEVTVLSDGAIRVSLVGWPILRIGTIGGTAGSAGSLVRLYGILMEPKGSGTRPAVLALADANCSAADIAGLTDRVPESRRLALQLARDGFVVFAPFFVQRRVFAQPWLDDRLWLVRLAYQTGRHLIGSEVLQTLSAASYLATLPGVDGKRLALAGAGQGGMTALYAAALDERFAAIETAGYLSDRTPDWEQPADRMMWGLRTRFGNKEIQDLVVARHFSADANSERTRLAEFLQAVPADDGSVTRSLDPERIATIAAHQVAQWQAFYRNMAIESARLRAARWKPNYSSPEAYTRSLADKREAYLDLIGRYPDVTGPLVARSVKLYDEPGLTGYRLSVRVYDGVHAYGILLVPKGMGVDEKRPVVFVQHGLGGIPEHALGVVPDSRADAVYMRFGLRLAERGYVVFAPMIATQNSAERERVVRRSHLVGMIPAGLDAKKFGRVIDYLSTLPFVDRDRFAFYGLSYGGYTALWTAPAEPRFSVVISSGHFNDWAVKTSDVTLGTAFPMYRDVSDMFNFGMLNVLNHSDLASLIAPRPFMIEMGDNDGVMVEPRHVVDLEIERVLEIYRRLRIPDKAACARFAGPHRIDGTEAYPFLDRWLGWKPR